MTAQVSILLTIVAIFTVLSVITVVRLEGESKK